MKGFVAALLVCSTGCYVHGVRGSGRLIRDERRVPPFSGVEVGGGIRATVESGPCAVVVEGDDNLVDLVETRVDEDLLSVHFRRFSHVWDADVRVHVSAPAVRHLAAHGGAEIAASLDPVDELQLEATGGARVRASHLEVGELSASGSGGARLELEGVARQLSLEMSGGTRVRAGRLDASVVRVHGSGGSTAEVRASELIKGSISGGSGVRLLGRASSRVKTSGGSSIDYDDD